MNALLAPLTGKRARELATRLLGTQREPTALDWTLEQAAGSAFLIHELARDPLAGGALSRSLDDILWDRVCALPSQERTLLTMVAVAGRPLRLKRVKGAANLAALALSGVPALCA